MRSAACGRKASSQTLHGGQETTLLALCMSLINFGGIRTCPRWPGVDRQEPDDRNPIYPPTGVRPVRALVGRSRLEVELAS